MRAPTTRKRQATQAGISVRLTDRCAIETYASGEVVARSESYSGVVGVFGVGAAEWLRKLRTGVPLRALATKEGRLNKEVDLLVSRLAALRMLEYRLDHPQHGGASIVIEPQVGDYWPQMPPLKNVDTLLLSRFAYLRRRGNAMVIESPLARAVVTILDPHLVTLIAMLATPQKVAQLRRSGGSLALVFLALLVDCRMALKTDDAGEDRARATDGDGALALWEFHDLLFHARSTAGRHANSIGAIYPHVGVIAPLPAVRPSWPGKKIDLRKFSAGAAQPDLPFVRLLRQRQSTRSFDDAQPITLLELSRFLECTSRIMSQAGSKPDLDDGGFTTRPYPSAGASYELELYLAVRACDGLARGFYHYDAGAGVLVPIGASSDDLDLLLSEAKYAMGVAGAPQIVLTMAARFGRVSWKYRSIAYALILKDVGVLTQTFYLAATEMGLGGCAIGIVNIDLFAKMTGIEFDVEGPVGQFAIGRIQSSQVSD